MVHEVWGQKYSSKFGTEFHITGHHAPTRASFHPKTRQDDFLYDTKSSWGLTSIFEGWFPTFQAPLLLIFSKGNGPKWGIWPCTAPFCPIFVAMIFFTDDSCKNDTNQVSGWWKIVFTPRAIRHVRRNWLFLSLGAISTSGSQAYNKPVPAQIL
jgi:hypothetical protein